MQNHDIKVFIFLAILIELVFIGGIVIFVFQYHRRKLIHENEKALLNEQHLQDLLNTRQKIQNQIMEDIGREIHDNVGQKLTLASIYANKANYDYNSSGQNEPIAAISSILNESIDELRKLSHSLTNSGMSISELRTLIQNECVRVNNLNICKLTCTFDSSECRISNTIRNFILRIVQEFLQNSLKHADCQNIRLLLECNESGLSLHIDDDGVGFNIGEVSIRPEKGIGLSNMNKRAELIGATFSITSVLNKGTRLDLFIPSIKLTNS